MFFQPKKSSSDKTDGGESTPLMAPSNASGNGSSKYYFLQGHNRTASRAADGGEVVEGIPEGAAADEFAPKQLGPMVSWFLLFSRIDRSNQSSSSRGWFSSSTG